jgi:hypothetical protein
LTSIDDASFFTSASFEDFIATAFNSNIAVDFIESAERVAFVLDVDSVGNESRTYSRRDGSQYSGTAQITALSPSVSAIPEPARLLCWASAC